MLQHTHLNYVSIVMDNNGIVIGNAKLFIQKVSTLGMSDLQCCDFILVHCWFCFLEAYK